MTNNLDPKGLAAAERAIMAGGAYADVAAAAVAAYLEHVPADATAAGSNTSAGEYQAIGYVTEEAVKLMLAAKPGWHFHLFAKDQSDPKASVALYDATAIQALVADRDEWRDHARHWHGAIQVIATLLDKPNPDAGEMPEAVRHLQQQFSEEVRIVNRIWAMFGSPSYEELAGRSIFDLVAAEQARAEAAEARVAALEKGLEAVAALSGRTLLGPMHDAERLHELGANNAFEQAAEIARSLLPTEGR